MTRYAILSDIHANIDALEAVLRHKDQLKPAVDQVWCLGDLVVYAVEPVRTIQRLEAEGILSREHPDKSQCVQGNNDFAVANQLTGEATIAQLLSNPQIDSPVNDPTARLRRVTIMAVHAWTIQTIQNGDPQSLEMLKNLRQEATLPGQDLILFHASACDALGMHGNYLRDEADAEEAFLCLTKSLAFFGHTHLPTVFQQTSTELPFDNVKRITPKPGEPIELDLHDGKKAMVNPGSVGQPRDRIPAASYAVYDTSGTVEFYRVEYPIEAVQKSILQVGGNINRFVVGEKDSVDFVEKNLVPITLAARFQDADW